MKVTKVHLGIEHLWGLALLVGIFAFVNTHPIRPQDFWWHIAIGREIVSTGRIPTTDIYSYTEAGEPYPSYQMFWLMETYLYQLFRSGGAALVIFMHSLLITTAYEIIFWICQQQTRSWRIAALSVFIAAALGLNDWNVRPQAITFLLGSIFLLAIYQYRKKQAWYWLVAFPLGMLVWANSHGTFFIGLALIALWWGQEIWDAIILGLKRTRNFDIKHILVPGIVLVLSVLICLINPRGIGIIDYLHTLTSNTVVQRLVPEWAPPTIHSYLGIIFFLVVLLSIILVVVSPKRLSISQIAYLIIFGLLGIRTSRGIVWFGLVMAPIIAEHVSALTARFQIKSKKSSTSEGSKVINLVFMIVILLMAVISIPWLKKLLPFPSAKAGLISSETPVQATEFLLEEKPPGRLFNSMSFGSYLIWAAYPAYQIFVDTRIELFADNVWSDYLDISNAAEGWDNRLNAYGVNTLMLSPVEQPNLVEAAKASGGWEMQYQDSSAIILVRK